VLRTTLASRLIHNAGPLAVTVIVALVAICALLVAVGVDIGVAAGAFFQATFGSARTFGEVLLRTTPLLIIAATLLPSLRAGIYNIGAPSQMGAGGLAATVVALNIPDAPATFSLLACALAAALAGGLTAAFPGYLKTRWKVNEIVSTLALNFIAVAVLGYLLNGPMQSDFANLPQSASLPPNSIIPTVFAGTRAHVGIFVALAAIPLLIALDRSIIGYRLRLYGTNPTLAKRAHVNPDSYTVWLFTLAGIGAGLAGWMQVAAIDSRLYPSIADPVGYAGLFVVLLGALSPIGIVFAALFLGALMHGGGSLQIGAGVSPEIVQVFLGVVLLAYAVMPRSAAGPIGRAKSK
jgi:ABC-type uncharacterized transport system permease subunit